MGDKTRLEMLRDEFKRLDDQSPSIFDLFVKDKSIQKTPIVAGARTVKHAVIDPVINGYKDFSRQLNGPSDLEKEYSPLGYPVSEEQHIANAMGIAGVIGGGGLVASPKASAGTVGMFIGKNAKNYNHEMQKKAEAMDAAGHSPEEIWKETQTFKGADGNWRQEISDKGLNFRSGFDTIPNVKGKYIKRLTDMPLGGVINHKELFSAYPNLTQGRAEVTKLAEWLPQSSERGMFTPGLEGSQFWEGKPDRYEIDALSEQKAREIAAHELQHGVQNIEGFSPGGSESNFTNNESNGLTAHQNYLKLAGEEEARLTAKRINMTKEQRENSFPPSMFDVPMDQQTVKSLVNLLKNK